MTSATIKAIRQGLQVRLDTVPGLSGRTYAYVPDGVNPPCAYVAGPDTVNFDAVFARGADTYRLIVRVLVDRTAEHSGQDALDDYVSGSGTASVKVAIEEDRSLGGACQTCQVQTMRNYGIHTVGDASYLGAELVIDCMA